MKNLTYLLLLFVLPIMGQDLNQTTAAKQKFRIATQAGFAQRIAKTSNETPPILREYTKDLKSGYSVGLDASYFVNYNWALGLKYSRFASEGSLKNMQLDFNDGTNAQGTIADDISINFIGPSFMSKYELNNPKHSFMGALSLGYISYLNKSLLVNRNMEIKGSTLGAVFDLGYDFAISKYISLGAQASLTGGALSKLKINDGFSATTLELEDDAMESLSRFDLGAGIRFKI